MLLAKRYVPSEIEPSIQARWQEAGTFNYSRDSSALTFSIDTPPPTVSGNLHLGHVFSYTHPDIMARFWRMRGLNVFYPMGFDDNGLPTERLVEKRTNRKASELGRQAFIEKCLLISEEVQAEYQRLWKRLGLSVDWRFTYRTIDATSRSLSQLSFLQLYENGRAYTKEAPTIWCPECQTALAQADLDDMERQSEFVTVIFKLENDVSLEISTTRPELLPACVAVFVHPQDFRYQHLIGRSATVSLFNQKVPIYADQFADPQTGTGAVMCCTFGDATDVFWWNTYSLSLVEAINPNGLTTSAAGRFSNLPVHIARERIISDLIETNQISHRKPIIQSVRVHERCDTPIEYIVTKQWFIRILDMKDELLKSGAMLNWHPAQMSARYKSWVENLNWDWCISRQRFFGIPIPVWYCQECGRAKLAEPAQLPVDPLVDQPVSPCSCGSNKFVPEQDVFDTWATSSLSPQIITRLMVGNADEASLEKTLTEAPIISLRPQAHEIIRTWAFYTIYKSLIHANQLPWKDILISGWGLAGKGMGKISKSRGGGPLPPLEMIERYSADAIRFWAASTNPGKDAVISEQKIKLGAKLINKLWNISRFCQQFLVDYHPKYSPHLLTAADRWILSRCQWLIRQVTQLLEKYEYASAKSEIESFFWLDLADNYLEMSKQRLYDKTQPTRDGARFTLYHVLLNLIKLFAPYIPHVTEEIYQKVFCPDIEIQDHSTPIPIQSIHILEWPTPQEYFEDKQSDIVGRQLVLIATAVRRYKSNHNLSLGTEIDKLQIIPNEYQDFQTLKANLQDAYDDIRSITRSNQVEIVKSNDAHLLQIEHNEEFDLFIHVGQDI